MNKYNKIAGEILLEPINVVWEWRKTLGYWEGIGIGSIAPTTQHFTWPTRFINIECLGCSLRKEATTVEIPSEEIPSVLSFWIERMAEEARVTGTILYSSVDKRPGKGTHPLARPDGFIDERHLE